MIGPNRFTGIWTVGTIARIACPKQEKARRFVVGTGVFRRTVRVWSYSTTLHRLDQERPFAHG